jgi:hypothetical protein
MQRRAENVIKANVALQSAVEGLSEALEVINKGFGGHAGARCTARAASFFEEKASSGITRPRHNVQPSDQGRHGQPIALRWHRVR